MLGLVFKKGKFTAAEERQLNAAMEVAAKVCSYYIKMLNHTLIPVRIRSADAQWRDLTQ